MFNWEKYKKKSNFGVITSFSHKTNPSDSLKTLVIFWFQFGQFMLRQSLWTFRGVTTQKNKAMTSEFDACSAVEQYSKPWLVDDWGIGMYWGYTNQI